MELNHLLNLVSELPENTILNYVRGTDTCTFVNVDIDGKRINAIVPNGESKSWAPSFLNELAPAIKENLPFNISQLLNNKGSYRPVIETIIAHTKEFYTVRKGTSTALVWIPSMPKKSLELEEIAESNIPLPKFEPNPTVLLDQEDLIKQVRKSFIQYWETIDQHGAQKDLYIDKYESFMNEALSELDFPYGNIFEVVDIRQLNDIIDQIAKSSSQRIFLLDSTLPQGNNGYVWSTNRHYRNFLTILSIADFRANIDKQVSNRLEVVSKKPTVTNRDYLRAMRTKPFLLLAGISGTGKSRIVKQMAFDSCPDIPLLRKDPVSPGNYCLIEVKPNWHDSTELLGYESKIGGANYQLTAFVKFLAKAMLYPNVPFFVCLDEMNLAPVEQYFAEFLSVLESRVKKLNPNGETHVISEPLIKADIFKKYKHTLEKALFSHEESSSGVVIGTVEPEVTYGKEAEVYAQLEEYGLRIPDNVIVIGTVNMDETTHQFSRKVIDRAMTIEMNLPEGNPFIDFFEKSSDLAYSSTPNDAMLYLATETKAGDVIVKLAEDNAEKTEWLKGEVASFLQGVNDALDNTPFKVAFRVQNELMLYFYQLWAEDKSANWEDVLALSCDQILMMKVLPRIEGDEELLEKPLDNLISFCADKYTNASKKLGEMKTRLEQSRFTSFWP